MRTTFQKFLQEHLKEQARPIGRPSGMLSVATAKSPATATRRQDFDDFQDLLIRPVDFPEFEKPIDPEGEDNTIPDPPDGLEPGPDLDGDGMPDYWYDPEQYPDGIPEGGIPEADRYNYEYVQITIGNEPHVIAMITTNLVVGGVTYTIGFLNQMWQLIAEVDGLPVLLPNIFPIDINARGSITWAYQDPTGAFWFTSGNIFSSTPPASWTSPTTGANVGGPGVWYPQGWGAWIGIEYNAEGIPINATIPLVPGGRTMPPWNPAGGTRTEGEVSIGIGFSIPFSDQTYGDWQSHRDAWNLFVDAYFEIFGNWPPESYWPPGHENPRHWFNDWAEGRPDDEPW